MPQALLPSAGLRSAGYVLPFTRDYSQHTIAPLGGAYSHLNSFADALVAKAQEIESDKRLSPVGKRDALHGFVNGLGMEALKKAAAAFQHASDEIDRIKERAKVAPVDKTDAAGAILRSETRTWLRSLDPAERTALLHAPDLEPAIALAITEAPAQLSGVLPQQKNSLIQRAMAATHPEEVKQIDEISTAAIELQSAMSVAVRLIDKKTGYPKHELAVQLGGREKFTAMTADTEIPIAAE